MFSLPKQPPVSPEIDYRAFRERMRTEAQAAEERIRCTPAIHEFAREMFLAAAVAEGSKLDADALILKIDRLSKIIF
jgi:hypothetical protein